MKNKFILQSGNSLIEMLVALAVAGILIAMAVTRMTKAQSNLQRQNLTREFKVSLVKRRAVTPAEMARLTRFAPFFN
jgi:prepilin-type N-terminal cleavage/methylation domain-containing protein